MLINNAALPMQAAPQAVIRSVLTSGHSDKLRFDFTHFDGVLGNAFESTTYKKNHVYASVEQTVTHLEEIFGPHLVQGMFKNNLSERCFYFWNIHNVLKERAGLQEVNSSVF